MRRYDQNKEDLNNWIALYLANYQQIASSYLLAMTVCCRFCESGEKEAGHLF